MIKRLAMVAMVVTGILVALIGLLIWFVGDYDDDELIELTFTGRM